MATTYKKTEAKLADDEMREYVNMKSRLDQEINAYYKANGKNPDSTWMRTKVNELSANKIRTENPWYTGGDDVVPVHMAEVEGVPQQYIDDMVRSIRILEPGRKEFTDIEIKNQWDMFITNMQVGESNVNLLMKRFEEFMKIKLEDKYK